MNVRHLCHLRETFLADWRLRYLAHGPLPPDIGVIGDLCVDDVINESTLKCEVTKALHTLTNDINILQADLDRKLFHQQFLSSIISELENIQVEDSSSCVSDRGVGFVNEKAESTAEEKDKTVAITKPCPSGLLGVYSLDSQGNDKIDVSYANDRVNDRDSGLNREGYTATDPVSDSLTPLSDSQTAGKFVSFIKVNEKSVNCSSKCEASTLTPADDEAASSGGQHEGSVGTPLTGSNSEMFKHRNKSGGRSGDNLVGSPPLGSKDNFMAVASRHNVEAAPPEPTPSASSPQLTRHFKMLKLTDGFDLVMTDSENAGGGEASNTSPGVNPSHVSDRDCQDSDTYRRVTSSTASGDFKIASSRKNSCDQKAEGGLTSQSESKTIPNIEHPYSSIGNKYKTDINTSQHSKHGDSDISESPVKTSPKPPTPLSRSSTNRGSGRVPPPVAKKPSRHGSIKPEVKPRVSSLSGSTHGSPKATQSTDVTASGVNHSHSTTTHTQATTTTLPHTRDSISCINKPYVVKSSSGTGFKANLVYDSSKITNNYVNIEKHPRNETGSTDSSSVGEERDRPSRPADSDVSTERNHIGCLVDGSSRHFIQALDSRAAPFTGGCDSEPVDNPGLSDRHGDGSEDISAIDALVGQSTSFILQGDLLMEKDGSPGGQGDSLPQETVMGDEDNALSDLAVKDALADLDMVIQNEAPDSPLDLDPSPTRRPARPAPQPPGDVTKKARTSSYENWTINRAVTTSLTHQETLSDEDDNADVSSSSILESHGSPKGSKDSGLSDDLGVMEDSQSSAIQPVDRFTNLHEIHELVNQSDEVDDVLEDSAMEESLLDKDLDNISVVSDVQFIGGDDVTEVASRLSAETDVTSVHSLSGEEEEASQDTSLDEADSGKEGILNMRQLLVKGVLDSERAYLDILSLLINYKKMLEAAGTTSQPVIANEDIKDIFSNIEDIFSIHQNFVTALEPKVKNWTHGEQIGEIFKVMVMRFESFRYYMTHYQQAVNTIHKCSQESSRFQELAEQIIVNSTIKEVTSLEDALFKPIQRVQRNSLVLNDLINYTPLDHEDYIELQKTQKLSMYNLEQYSKSATRPLSNEGNRRLVKSSFLVELVNGQRKLRYVFLFSDLIICTKRETNRSNKASFDIKWFSSLSAMTCDTKFAYKDDTKHSKRDDIDDLKNKVKLLKKQLKVEVKKYDDKDRHRSVVNLGGATRSIEKLRKKINQTEAQLILACPKLPFKVSLQRGKVYTLLMTTDYEREEWKETIASLSKNCNPRGDQQSQNNSILMQELINSVKETPQINKIGNVLLEKDEDVLNGILNVTIQKMNGLSRECDTYCCLEMDTFGHFFMKARTNICAGSLYPSWNEDFELELEGSQTLRILCFRKEANENEQGDTLLGRGALELSKSWLKGSFQEKTVVMNEVSLVISVRHTSVEKTMRRTPSMTGSAVFGVDISRLARREGKPVPTIVVDCLREVEKRGLDEVGIYRVSGVTSELQTTKKMFDKNIKLGAARLSEIDIHAVTGTLKLYFRELPSPLFTEEYYQSFVDTLRLTDDEAKAQCMLSLLHELPDTNYFTIVTLLDHLIKVARNVAENKMSISNVATIFGPTLLAPASKATSSNPLEMMSKGAEQVMHQSSVVNYLLELAVSGRDLRKSSQ